MMTYAVVLSVVVVATVANTEQSLQPTYPPTAGGASGEVTSRATGDYGESGQVGTTSLPETKSGVSNMSSGEFQEFVNSVHPTNNDNQDRESVPLTTPTDDSKSSHALPPVISHSGIRLPPKLPVSNTEPVDSTSKDAKSFFKWLDTIHPTTGDNFQTENRVGADDITHMSADKFFTFINSIHPKQSLASGHTGVDSIPNTSIEHQENILSQYKAILIIGTTCGTLVVCAVIISAAILLRRNKSKNSVVKEVHNVTLQEVVGVPNARVLKPGVYTVNNDRYQQTFMGIPANNEIWKELQMLPESAPSVMPESELPGK